ncbi:DNA annealing helicase and endonuclease ZRANB3 isoform X9 [Syngnathoides biaculeatus]|uniref:DNA annealing helicase and endonuclease ZRANB3 isoform X9 n=1 Tax=Syngnathoides biaculeatus TaxID=300417 RepID=UPI002ADD36BC|nr:DNA annealing helicase and endonuclease ZRANB3 isoform X9 [Syngnathoides biaculeatus]
MLQPKILSPPQLIFVVYLLLSYLIQATGEDVIMTTDGSGPPQPSYCDTRWSQQMSRLPPKLLERLMPFQREGVRFALSKNGRCMIADEMGLGKTVQAIAVSYAFRKEWPLLVVVPSSLKYLWIEELERWIPELQPGDINLVENKSDTMGISRSKVTVLGYGLLTTDARPLVEALSRRAFSVVVVDESHYLKSRNAARTKLLVPLIRSAKRAILLTGTPALGRPEELFMQIDALYPKMFGTWTDYAKKYCNAHYRYFGPRRQWDCRGASNLEELHQQLSQIMIRRLKAKVLSQLPPKIRQRIPFDLPKDAAKEATASFAEWERLMKGSGSEVVAISNSFAEVMSLITRMYKQTATAKAGAVKDYIKMMLDTEQLKFLVFAHHLTMLQACTEAAIEAKESVTGSTLNGRKEYLKAEEGDKDKWDFLNFASAWTPGKLLLERNTGLDADEDVYFTHFEREKQHDIRNFFSPSTNREKKRKRLQDEAESSYTSSEINNSAACSGAISETKKEESFQASITDNCDFSPQIKRIRELRSSPSQRSGFKVRRRVKQEASMPACFMAQQYLLESNPSCEPWACAVCTYSNNNLLPYCEMCEAPRSSSVLISEPTRSESPPAETEQMCHIQSNSDQELELSCQKLHTTKLCKGKQSGEEDELPKDKQKARETRGGDNQQLKGKQSMEKQGGGSGTGGGSCVLLEHAHELKANDSEEGGDPAYQSLLFCASQYTDRIYIYNKDGAPLNLSFIPLDIKLTNWDDLPEDFSQHRENRLQVLRFVQEWCGLAAMKQKLLRRSNLFYHSPTLGLQQLATSQRQHNSTRRYLTRDDVAQASLSQAQQEGGSVRVVAKEDFFRKRKSISSLNSLISVRFPMTSPHSQESLVHHFVCLKQGKRLSPNSSGKFVVEQPTPGFLQAMDRQCVPLCLSCQKACLTTCRAWDTRFCSNKCQEEFHLRSSQTYMRSRVLEVERGVCQHCGLHAHDLFVKVRDAPPFQRKEILENTWLAQLSLKQLNEMIRAPVEGDFWQVDHIRPVYSGGGQCSLDNLQTLCTVCHRARTAQQAKERSQMRKSATASKVASDISRFFIKK